MKKLHEILPESELLHKYLTESLKDEEYKSIVMKLIHEFKPLQRFKPELYEAEIIVRSIENLRQLVHELILKPHGTELSRLVWDRWITSDERQALGDLSPSLLKKILKRRPIVTYDEMSKKPDLRLIWEKQ